MVTLSPVGGCVVVAVTRQMPGLAGSTAADSMAVCGRAIVARLSQQRSSFALAIAGFGVIPSGGWKPKPPAPGGGPPRFPWP
ncbi:MAG TPA: hypothetical protein VME17_15830 [Bryobacteraceae bacterium]|nr:hypothetical protein [Bryobacteraceae bacterium]